MSEEAFGKLHWEDLMATTHRMIEAELQGQELTPPKDIIECARETRSENILNDLC